MQSLNQNLNFAQGVPQVRNFITRNLKLKTVGQPANQSLQQQMARSPIPKSGLVIKAPNVLDLAPSTDHKSVILNDMSTQTPKSTQRQQTHIVKIKKVRQQTA